MTLRVIGAGLGRTGTLSLKLALEHLGFGQCYHMSEMLAQSRDHLPLWIEAAKGHPRWETIFAGCQSTVDYPGCMFWRELLSQYPDARVILTTRDPDKWFDSAMATIFSEAHRARLEGNPQMAEFFRLTVFGDLGEWLGDRAAMIEYFNAWNQSAIDGVPAERLLVYKAGDGWQPLCDFLGVPVPHEPYPRVNSREEMAERAGELGSESGPPPPEAIEAMIRGYLDGLRARTFPATA